MPDLLVVGTLHTLDSSRPRAQAALLGEGGAVPVRADAHGHPLLHGRNLAEVRLGGAASEQECVERVARFLQFVPAGQWIRGNSWDQNLWPGRAFPDAALLSAATPRHPVALARIDVHALWCNDLALQAAQITSTTADPPGGRMPRRGEGQPIRGL